MRTRTEVQLLNLRQRYKDALEAVRSAPVVDLRAFRLAYTLYKTSEYVLVEYRMSEKYVA